jgi:hypothetical protein
MPAFFDLASDQERFGFPIDASTSGILYFLEL